MRALLFLVLALPLLGTEPPRRVVSLNLVTDQYVLAFGAADQIAAVSWLAADPRWSAVATEAAAHTLVRGSAEEVVQLRPDLILTGRYTTPAATAAARRLGLRVVEFDLATDFAAIADQMRAVGALLGPAAAARAEAAALRLESRVELLRQRDVRPLRILSFGTSGWTDGSGTLADAVIRAAGHRNAAAESGVEGLQQRALEHLLALRPDVILLPETDPAFPSLAELALHHPAWRRVGGGVRVVRLPGPALTTGGPQTADAAEALQRALQP